MQSIAGIGDHKVYRGFPQFLGGKNVESIEVPFGWDSAYMRIRSISNRARGHALVDVGRRSRRCHRVGEGLGRDW